MLDRFGWRSWWAGCAKRRPEHALALLSVLALLAAAPKLAAQPLGGTEDTRIRVGFSNLVARLDSDEIGFAEAEYRVHILEALRAAGFNAVGAESLVFERDEGGRADLILGGTVRELECKAVGRRTNCRVGIEWELLDREQDAVVYRALTRYMEPNVDRTKGAVVGRKLTIGALRWLISRPRFATLLSRKAELPVNEVSYPKAGFRICSAQARELPAQFNEVADATYLIKQAGGFGSGFGISPDGLVLTAAHVVASKSVELTPRGGSATLTGTVVRISRHQDVALIALTGPHSSEHPCLALQSTPPATGDDVYAIGSPASQDLAFSMTRGIVSGLRLQEGVQLVQTDASLSPGNSGGPLLDAHAQVVGVVTRKIAGRAVEGLGFGVQIQDALHALGLEPELTTAASLLSASAAPVDTSAKSKAAFVDFEGSMPSLDPEGDLRQNKAVDLARRLREQDAARPWFVKPMRYVGLTASIVGSFGILYSTSAANDKNITHTEFLKYRTQNDVSWLIFGLGTAAFAVSYPLEPRLAPSRFASAKRRNWSLVVGAAQAGVSGVFQ